MAERGLLTIVNDVEINPAIIADWIAQQRLVYDIEKIAIDSYRYTVLSRALRDVGYDANEKQVKLVRPSDIMQVVQKISSMFIGKNSFKYGKIEPKRRKTDGFMAFVNAVILEEELPDAIDFEALPVILL